MPFAVRQWPAAPDPRSSLFSFEGWNWGQVVSFQWVVSSFGARGAWSFLNDGFIVPSVSDDGVDTQWSAAVPGSGGTVVTLSKFGHPAPIGIPPFTIEWLWTVDMPQTGEQGRSFDFLLRPDAIQVFGPLEMLDSGVPIPNLPNPVTITPAIWNLQTP
jgi:hypothetical protein